MKRALGAVADRGPRGGRRCPPPPRPPSWRSSGIPSAGRIARSPKRTSRSSSRSQSKYRIEGTFQGDYLRGAGQDPRGGRDQDRAGRLPRDRRGHAAALAVGIVREPRALRQGPERHQPRRLPPRANPEHLLLLSSASRRRRSSRCRSSAARPSSINNADMLQSKGIAAPATWDELRRRRRQADRPRGQRHQGSYGFEVPIDWWFWYALLHEAGGKSYTRRQEGRLPGEGRRGAPVLGGSREQGQDDEAAPGQGLQRVGGDEHRLRQPAGGHDLHVDGIPQLHDRERQVQARHRVSYPGKVKQAVPTGGAPSSSSHGTRRRPRKRPGGHSSSG